MTFTTSQAKANDSSWRLEAKWLMALTGTGLDEDETPANARVADDGGTRLTDDGGVRVVDVETGVNSLLTEDGDNLLTEEGDSLQHE